LIEVAKNWPAGLLLSAVQAGDIDAARRLTANAGSVLLRGEI